MAGWLWVRPFLSSKATEPFAELVADYTKTHFNLSSSADSVDFTYVSVALYDAVMLYAHAATRVLSEGGDLADGEAVTKAVRSTSIDGMGGSVVSLDSSGDRVESYEVMNIVLLETSGVAQMDSVPVGVFNNSMLGTLKPYKAYERAVVWPGNAMEAPADCSREPSHAVEPIHFALLMPFSGAWDVGKRIAGAAAFAVERINADETLLPGRRLEYSWEDAGCSAPQGLAVMGELLGGASRVNAVIGSDAALCAR